jgi:hypothetical protein
MDEKRTSSIRAVTDLLAEMTERAIKLEMEVEEAKADALNWFRNWEASEARNRDVDAKQEKELEEHANTKKILQGLLDDIEKGELTYGSHQ